MTKAKKRRGQQALSETVPADRQQTADYIATVSHELSEMAGQTGLLFLKYLLDMTVEEAVKQGGTAARGRTGERVKSPGK